jgi:hypothetical protein
MLAVDEVLEALVDRRTIIDRTAQGRTQWRTPVRCCCGPHRFARDHVPSSIENRHWQRPAYQARDIAERLRERDVLPAENVCSPIRPWRNTATWILGDDCATNLIQRIRGIKS